jgi:hypothetical protein
MGGITILGAGSLIGGVGSASVITIIIEPYNLQNRIYFIMSPPNGDCHDKPTKI